MYWTRTTEIYQETETFLSSVMSEQVFSSWLNMAGCTVREAPAVTIGRALMGNTQHDEMAKKMYVNI